MFMERGCPRNSTTVSSATGRFDTHIARHSFLVDPSVEWPPDPEEGLRRKGGEREETGTALTHTDKML